MKAGRLVILRRDDLQRFAPEPVNLLVFDNPRRGFQETGSVDAPSGFPLEDH
jgi:hypothetical protein